MIRLFRKPLIIMTPKSLLRHPKAISEIGDLAKGGFQTVIGEVNKAVVAEKVKRIVVCSGRVYYDLLKERDEALQREDVVILRMEQLYPFPHKSFSAELAKYPNATELVWTQDEPQNQGAWFFVQHHIMESMSDGQKLGYAGRAASASPAAGYASKHTEQLKELLAQSFGKLKGFVLTK
jgi:2-oxoglutarate dehydrogenase E1 component